MEEEKNVNQDQDTPRETAPHISMELKAESARVTNLTMDGSHLVLTIEAELASSLVKAAPNAPAAREQQPAPQSQIEEETRHAEYGDAYETVASTADAAETPLPSADSVSERETQEQTLQPADLIPDSVMEQVFAVGAGVGGQPPVQGNQSAGAGMTGGTPAMAEKGPGSEAVAMPAPSSASLPFETEPASFSREQQAAETNCTAEDNRQPGAAADTAATMPGSENDANNLRDIYENDTEDQFSRSNVGVSPKSPASSAKDNDPKQKTAQIVMPFSSFPQEEALSETAELPHIDLKPQPQAEVADQKQEKGWIENYLGEKREGHDTTTQAFSYETFETKVQPFTPAPPSRTAEESAAGGETEDLPARPAAEPAEKEDPESAVAPSAAEAEYENAAMPDCQSQALPVEQEKEETAGPALLEPAQPDLDAPGAEQEEKVLRVELEHFEDSLAMAEESSTIGGERHGEPLPSMSFGIEPPVSNSDEKRIPAEPEVQPGAEKEQTLDQPASAAFSPELQSKQAVEEHFPEQAQESAPSQSIDSSFSAAPDVRNESATPTGQINPDDQPAARQEQPAPPPAAQPQPPCEAYSRDQPKQLDKIADPALPPTPPVGGTTVLIRYTCPKCKTQGMQAVDKVGTVVNCSNCGKAMRLVMKK